MSPDLSIGERRYGCLVFVVGPSGAGKDTLIRGAQSRLAGDTRICFAQRVITRPADGSEENESVDAAEFKARQLRGDFVLTWHAHDLSYGVPVATLSLVRTGHVVVCNGSRAMIDAARGAFGKVFVVLVTAPAAVLQARLHARGRDGDIAGRIARKISNPAEEACDLVIDNSGPIAAGVEVLCQALVRLAQQFGDAAKTGSDPAQR